MEDDDELEATPSGKFYRMKMDRMKDDLRKIGERSCWWTGLIIVGLFATTACRHWYEYVPTLTFILFVYVRSFHTAREFGVLQARIHMMARMTEFELPPLAYWAV